MAPSPVDRLYSEFASLVQLLGNGAEPSLLLSAQDNFRKSLLLAAASYFEKRITDDIYAYSQNVTSSDELLTSFVRNKALKRQFHTLFNWEANNANQFFGLFGEGFKQFMVARVAADATLEDSIRALIELGYERNRLVHEDFATFPLEKTSDEIFALYTSAASFVNSLLATFSDYSQPKV